MGVTSLGSKVYFAGGMNDSGLKSTVEIYDFSTGLWDTTQHLSVARDLVTATTCGSKILFAGGVDFFSSSNVYATVDIYDTLTHQWSVHQLSAARFSITALSYGNKVIFAGGANPQMQAFNNIDIYNCETDSWSVEYLPVPKFTYGGVVNNLGILPGGIDSTGSVTKRVDIYNFFTGTWSVDSLSVARAWVGVTTIGDKMLIAGGATHDAVQTNIVDIYDATAGTWDTATLSLARSFCDNQNAVNVCGKAYFVGGGKLNLNGPFWEAAYNRIDIYDLTTNTWSVDVIPTSTATVHRAAASIGDQFIIAGGIWSNYASNAEIYACPNVGFKIYTENILTIYPNPTTGLITISLPVNSPQSHLSILNSVGQEILQQTISNSKVQINIRNMPPGIYVVKVVLGNKVHTEKIIKE